MLLDDMMTVLAAFGTPGSTLVKGRLPEQPVNAVAVNQYGGSDGVHHMGGSGQTIAIERPRFQVAVRNTDQEVAWTTARAIKALLDGFEGQVNGCVYGAIFLVGDLGEIAEDGNLATRVTGSYEVKKDPS